MRKYYTNWLLIIGSLMFILIVVSLASLCVGSTTIKFSTILNFFSLSKDSAEYNILAKIRLPRILLGFAVGGALSLAGTILQTIFRNPLIEPYTLGISGGASLGVCFVFLFKIYTFIGSIAFPLAGFIGALLTIFILYFLRMKKEGGQLSNIILTGVMISFVSSSLVMLMMAISSSDDISSIIYWIMGSLDEPNFYLIALVLIVSLFCLIITHFYALELNAIVVGEDDAKLLGINTKKLQIIMFVLASILTGLSVSVSGIIGFVGLVVPHFVRMFTGLDHRLLLSASFIAGASFLIVSDTFARTIISPIELPVGVITGIIGGIVFIYTLSHKKFVL